MSVWKARTAAVLGAVLALAGGASAVGGAATLAAPQPVVADPVDPSTRTGTSADTAAASCFEIKQLHPDSSDGSYWLLTPQLTGPQEFWCDMTTDGGGWVRIGTGREQWSTTYDGKGNVDELRLAQPPLTRAVQLPSTTVDALLNGGRVDALPDGLRVKRAANATGSSWQEVRFGHAQRDRWVWTFGAEHRVAGYDIGGATGSGGQTNNFGSGSTTSRVDARIQSTQGFRWGFAYGSSVVGTNSATTYLWSRSDGQGSALPYSEMYLRPTLMSQDLIFDPVPDSGTASIEQTDAAANAAQVNPWGVSGTAGSTGTEGNVEVQAFEQVGNVMFVGGNFRYVQRDSAGAGRVEQSYLAAFNATTGEYIPGFTPTFNEQVRALKALPNGMLAVGGDFTQANGGAVQGLVALDVTSGSTVPSWGVTIENGVTPGVVRVESIDVDGDYLYLGGSFTHLSRADGGGKLYSRNAGRVSVASGDPNRWNPEFNGTVLDVATSEDGSRAYFSGFFGASRQQTAFRAAAVLTDGDGTLDPTPWSPTWSSSNKNYQRTIDQVGDRVWVGGSEHALFDFSTSTYDKLGGSVTKRGGDFQAMDGEGGLLYAGCHCNNWVYQDAYTWSNVGTGWTQADAIGWFGLWDTATGDYVPEFTPEFSLRRGSGIWAIEIADDGTVWAGGDVTSGLTTSGGRWLGGFGRWAPRDTTAPSAPSSLRASSQTPSTVTLAWNAATGGVSGYQIVRDDRVISATSGGRSATVPKGGENRFFVRAVDAAGNVSASNTVFAPGDSNPAPTAVIDYEAIGLATAFDASGSTDDGTLDRYTWDFGDGTSATGMTAEHTYAADGTYTVTLTVTDDQGATGTATQEVTVAATPNEEPVAEFTTSVVELAVSVDGSGSSDADGQIVSYEWDFGDGGSATGVSVEHAYAADGTYRVTLTVTDDQGATGTSTQDVSVDATGDPVTATVIERNASWSWYYEAPEPQADWKQLAADVSSWESGSAPLGFGFSAVATDIDIEGPTSDRPRAAYFVRKFEVTDASRVMSLRLDTVANDGVVIYVNGTEVGRHNMQDGDVTHYTFAPTARNVTTANNDPVVIDVPPGLLVDGANVVTAETHVNYRGTRDVSFELDAQLKTQ